MRLVDGEILVGTLDKMIEVYEALNGGRASAYITGLKVAKAAILDANEIRSIDSNLFDEEETHYNCTVQILTNSVTGEKSIGWWEE